MPLNTSTQSGGSGAPGASEATLQSLLTVAQDIQTLVTSISNEDYATEATLASFNNAVQALLTTVNTSIQNNTTTLSGDLTDLITEVQTSTGDIINEIQAFATQNNTDLSSIITELQTSNTTLTTMAGDIATLVAIFNNNGTLNPVVLNTPGFVGSIPANWEAYSIFFRGRGGTFSVFQMDDKSGFEDKVDGGNTDSIPFTVPTTVGIDKVTQVEIYLRN